MSDALAFLSGVGSYHHHRRVHLSDVWDQDGPYGFMVVAHRWALDGERVSFESAAHGRTYHVVLEPVCDAGGQVVGVNGTANA